MTANIFWGGIPQSYTKTIQVTRTRPNSEVKFASELDKASNSSYDKNTWGTVIDILKDVPGVMSVTSTITANTEQTLVQLNVWEFPLDRIVDQLNKRTQHLLVEIEEYEQAQGITAHSQEL